ncbi:hypothetical protein ACI2KH_18065 [Roseomonas mucosa]|uniref:hypothetical protein n=1 Tax=Roseomonas mucosa TaxID=207340 RepID=UPI00384C2150
MSATMSAAPQAPPPSPVGKDPLRELIERMDQHRQAIAAHDPRLNQQIEALAMNSQNAAVLADATFRTRVAYVYQDFARLAGPAAGMPDQLRSELEQLATTAPGLTNQRIHDMLREVPKLNDPKLAGDIRRLAVEVGREGGDQNRPAVLDKIEPLERKLDLLGPPPAPPRTAPDTPPPRAAEAAQAQAAVASPKPEERVQAAKSPGEGPQAASPASTPGVPPQQTSGPSRPPEAQPAGAAPPASAQATTTAVRGGGVLGRAIVMMADPRPEVRLPWDQPPTPIGDRIERVVSRFSDDTALKVAEKSGQKAVEALRGFAQEAGAGVMARINEAARSDPQGIQGVLSEMREGGRHAELRTQFNNALVQEKGVAAAYDAAASAVKQYGADRQNAEAVLLKRPGPGVLAGRFERLDAQIGEAASQVPARQEGKSVMEELGQRVADVVRRATEAVRTALQGEPRASAPASSSPSPGL